MKSPEALKGYSFKSKPYGHQVEALNISALETYYGLLMEQGTGKTKTILDNAAIAYNLGRINALAVVAPNGVHRDWVLKAVPEHLPDYIPRRCAYWASDARVKERKAMEALFDTGQVLRIFTFNIEAIAHPRAFAMLKRFLQATNAMFVIDESHRIKTHNSAVTKNILKLRNLGVMRRILTGSPIAEGPLDAFPQLMFLEPSILPTQSFATFRARYAEIMPEDAALIRDIKERNNLKFAPTLIQRDRAGRPIYKNLDELRNIVASCTFRVLKSECLDLPPKVYVRQSVDLHPTQRAAYERVIALATLGVGDGEEAVAPVAKLNVIMYLQAILCGVMPAAVSPTGEKMLLFKKPEDNPRIEALLSNLESTAESCIIWCRFTHDVLSVRDAIQNSEFGKDSVVCYYGEMDRAERDEAVRRFMTREARFFVGNAEAGGTGLNLFVASQVHYYSNSFKLLTRLQSEDRAHRIGQENRVLYVDYEVENTVDSKILQAYVDKKDVADAITGDEFKEWIKLS